MSRRRSIAPSDRDAERRPSVFHVTGADRLTHRRESIMVAASHGMDLSSLQGAGGGGRKRPSIVTCGEDDCLAPEKPPPDNLGN